MTDKQWAIAYYSMQEYTLKQVALIVGVTDNYARRVFNRIDEIDLSSYVPSIENEWRKQTLDYIIRSAPYVHIPETQRYGYISLLFKVGFEYSQIRKIFPTADTKLIYVAMHRSKAWQTFNPEIINVSRSDYADLLRLKH